MAGRGTRLRPQTLITPKPLIEIAGKTIVQRIVDVVTKNYTKPIKNIGFIIEKPDVNIEKKAKSGFVLLSTETAIIPIIPIKKTMGIIIKKDSLRLRFNTA